MNTAVKPHLVISRRMHKIIYSVLPLSYTLCMLTYIHIYVHTHILVHVYTCIHTNKHIYTYIHAHTYARLYRPRCFFFICHWSLDLSFYKKISFQKFEFCTRRNPNTLHGIAQVRRTTRF